MAAEQNVSPPTLESALAATAWLTTALEKYQSNFLVKDYKLRYAIALLKICREHRDGVAVLSHLSGRTSAPVVARSAFEAYVLALWVIDFGNVEALQHFLNGTGNVQPPTLKKLIQILLKAEHPMSKFINSLQPYCSALADYAHGYGRQVSRWLITEEITSSHSDVEIMELLLFADTIAVLAAITHERIAGGDVERGARLLRVVLSRDYFDVSARDFY